MWAKDSKPVKAVKLMKSQETANRATSRLFSRPKRLALDRFTTEVTPIITSKIGALNQQPSNTEAKTLLEAQAPTQILDKGLVTQTQLSEARKTW